MARDAPSGEQQLGKREGGPSMRYRRHLGRRREIAASERRHVGAISAETRRAMGESIYFIRDVESGAIKIGRAVDPGYRLYKLQCGNPGELRLLATIPHPEAAEAERRLHVAFAGARLRREWFKPTRDLLRLVRVASRKAGAKDVVASVLYLADAEPARMGVEAAIHAHGWTLREWRDLGDPLDLL